jgi:hypothetical protein
VATAAAQLQHDREIASKKMETAVKLAMEMAGRAYLKEQKEKAGSQLIPEIAAALEVKLFDEPKEEPAGDVQPPQGAAPNSFLVPRLHKLSFPTYDGKEDPLPWLNHCEQFFQGKLTLEHEQIWYASYNLTGSTQQWYMRLTQDKEVTEWSYFAHYINESFRPPTWHNPLGKLASLRKTTTVDEYTERFLAHVARTEPLDEQQQVNIYTAGLLEPLKMDFELQNPQDMEMAMSLVWAYKR